MEVKDDKSNVLQAVKIINYEGMDEAFIVETETGNVGPITSKKLSLPDITTKDGKVYKTVRLDLMFAQGISISHSAGNADIPYGDLTGEFVKFFVYRDKKNKTLEKAVAPVAVANQGEVRKLYYPSGKLLMEAAFINDNPNGPIKSYYESGGLHGVVTFVNGIQDGPVRIYYENGKLARELTYIKGKKEGKLKLYYENGKLKWEALYTNDILNGPSKIYYENGKLLCEGTYKNGKEDGPVKVYDKNGNLTDDRTFIDTDLGEK